MAPTTVTRQQWGARAPRGAVATTSWSNRVGVAIHHSAGPTSQTVKQIQNYQMDVRGWSDIGYNWLVTQDGRLWEGRAGGWLAIGAHAAGQNTAWVGVCWIGTSGNTAPSAAALATLRWVVDEARRRAGRRLEVRGHGQVPGQATECPGSRLRAWIADGLPIEEDDMPLSDTDLDKIKDTLMPFLRFEVNEEVWAGQGTGRLNHGFYSNGVGARNGWAYGKVVLAELKAAVAAQKKRDEAILAGITGLDTAAILARIDQRAAEDMARDAALVELVERGQSGELDAAEVVRLIGAKLSAAAVLDAG